MSLFAIVGSDPVRSIFFKKKSAIVDDPSDTWKSKLDRWGNAQPRKYRHFASPPVERTPMVIIVCNKP